MSLTTLDSEAPRPFTANLGLLGSLVQHPHVGGQNDLPLFLDPLSSFSRFRPTLAVSVPDPGLGYSAVT